MSETFEYNEVKILDQEVTDECLESAAGQIGEPAGIYTLGSCTGYFSCPPQ